MAKITIEYESETFRSQTFEILDKIIDHIPANCKVTITFGDN